MLLTVRNEVRAGSFVFERSADSYNFPAGKPMRTNAVTVRDATCTNVDINERTGFSFGKSA
jgi:hypothetical protein